MRWQVGPRWLHSWPSHDPKGEFERLVAALDAVLDAGGADESLTLPASLARSPG